MIGRIVEVAGEGRYLHVYRGFLEISHKTHVLGRVPLDQISALIVNAYGATYSNELLVTLARQGVPVVLCGNQHIPEAVLLPCETHHIQGARLDAQLSASRPMNKRLWQQLVKAKLASQGAVLEYFCFPSAPLFALVSKVKSGDTGNMEGVGARRYWPLLMGKGFHRDRQEGGLNAMLNYGYTVLRATVARHLLATGLNPGIGLAHSNDGNPLRLVDDLMEPFRPFVDAKVRQLHDNEQNEINAYVKKCLAELMIAPCKYEDGNGPLANAIQRACVSLMQVYTGEKTCLSLPVISALEIGVLLGCMSDAQETAEP